MRTTALPAELDRTKFNTRSKGRSQMVAVEYQSTIWELNDEVAEQMFMEGVILRNETINGNHAVSMSFNDDWGHKTYEAICLAVAVFQADQAIMEGHATAETECAHDNLTDAVVILKGGRV
jgi:hypothetical protein